MANPVSPLTPLIYRYRQENQQDVPDYPDARPDPLRTSQPPGSEAYRDPVPAGQADPGPEDVHRVSGEGSGPDYRGERVGPEHRPGREAVDQMTSGGLGKHASEYIEMKWDSYMIHQYVAWSWQDSCFARISQGRTTDTITMEMLWD